MSRIDLRPQIQIKRRGSSHITLSISGSKRGWSSNANVVFCMLFYYSMVGFISFILSNDSKISVVWVQISKKLQNNNVTSGYKDKRIGCGIKTRIGVFKKWPLSWPWTTIWGFAECEVIKNHLKITPSKFVATQGWNPFKPSSPSASSSSTCYIYEQNITEPLTHLV